MVHALCDACVMRAFHAHAYFAPAPSLRAAKSAAVALAAEHWLSSSSSFGRGLFGTFPTLAVGLGHVVTTWRACGGLENFGYTVRREVVQTIHERAICRSNGGSSLTCLAVPFQTAGRWTGSEHNTHLTRARATRTRHEARTRMSTLTTHTRCTIQAQDALVARVARIGLPALYPHAPALPPYPDRIHTIIQTHGRARGALRRARARAQEKGDINAIHMQCTP